MEDKLNDYFKSNNFDVFEPHQGHKSRFEKKLNHFNNKKKTTTFFWLQIAASIVLFLGLGIASYQQQTSFDLATLDANASKAQDFFVTTINNELKAIEQYRNLDTEMVIEDALNEIEELQDEHDILFKELSIKENKSQIIKEIIKNYQQRLNILEQLLLQLEVLKNPAKLELQDDEII